MKLVLLLLVVVGCSHDTARSRDKLVQEIADYAAQLKRGGPAQPGDLTNVRPPSEDELRWLKDPSDHDPYERQILGIRLVDECEHIGTANRDAAWLLAVVDIFADMVDVLRGEMGSDAASAHSLGELANMSIEVAEVQLRNLPGLAAPAYRELLAGWRARAGKLRPWWTQAECDNVRTIVGDREGSENDATTRQALQDLAAQLHDCKGEGR